MNGEPEWFQKNPEGSREKYARLFRPEAYFGGYKTSYRVDYATATIGEKSPNYFHLPEAAIERVYSWMPKARFIAIRRDPVDRLWSHLKKAAKKRDWSVTTAPAKWIRKFLRENGHKGHQDFFEARWKAVVGEALLVVEYESIARDSESTFARICRHLDIALVGEDVIGSLHQVIGPSTDSVRPDARWREVIQAAIDSAVP